MREGGGPGGRVLQWRQPKVTSRSYVLMDGDLEVAHLAFRSALGSLARGEFQGRAFTFKRGGFLCPFISIRKEGEEENLAILRFGWGFKLAGQLTMANGRSYVFSGPSMQDDSFSLSDSSGRVLCRMTQESGLLRRKGEFVDLGMGHGDPEPLLIALVLWYAAMMVFDEETAASSAALPGTCPTEGVDESCPR